MGALRTLLAALDYPRAQSFSHADEAAFRALVAWLENVKIRHYPVDQRAALGDVRGDGWPDALAAYLRELECPLPASGASRQALLEWLLAFAVSLEYADGAEQYSATAAELAAQQERQAAAAPPRAAQPFPDLRAPEVQQHLAELFQLLHLKQRPSAAAAAAAAAAAGRVGEEGGEGGRGGDEGGDDDGLLRQLRDARAVLRDAVLPSLTDASAAAAVQGGGGGGVLEGLPLGFETGDARVDRLATVLRLLYVRDLRGLQAAVDAAIVELQEHTANPRTDASLGKVGR